MLKSSELISILNEIEIMYPNAGCELIYHNMFELVVCVSLSAQTTDASVNKVTPILFSKYNDVYSLANASFDDVYNIIKVLGLANNKAKNIIALSKKIVDDFNGIVPSTFDELTTLPGVGRKTANVVLSEGFGIQRIAVDTHVERVCKRLGVVENDASVLDVENTLMSLVDESKWHRTHHLLLFFGRYFCKASKPNCDKCFYKDKCKK